MSGRLEFAVIGDPVEHSLSPRLFRRLFDELGVAADYRALHTRPEELGRRVESVRAGELGGISVTLPHKEPVIPWLDELSPIASLTGAVNCLAPGGPRRVIGHNTDGRGFELALGQAGVKLAGASVLILGSGGAARAVAFTAVQSGARSLVIANRTPARASLLARDLIASGLASDAAGEKTARAFCCPVSVLELSPRSLGGPRADIVVNATSVGLDSSADPLPETFHLGAGQAVLDMVYRPVQTRLLARALARGALAIDGLWMLVYQALEQFRIWSLGSVPADAAARLHSMLGKEAR